MGTNKANGPGSAARHVAANIRMLRDARGISAKKLASMLEEHGRPLQTSAVTRVERCERAVNVDDLVAFAAVLDVQPATLLEPFECSTCRGEPPSGFACRTCGAEG